MRHRLSVRIATLFLVVSLAAPVMAAPRRDDSEIGPIDRMERIISSVVSHIVHIFDLSEITPPK